VTKSGISFSGILERAEVVRSARDDDGHAERLRVGVGHAVAAGLRVDIVWYRRILEEVELFGSRDAPALRLHVARDAQLCARGACHPVAPARRCPRSASASGRRARADRYLSLGHDERAEYAVQILGLEENKQILKDVVAETRAAAHIGENDKQPPA
jgi:hypothetical protein